jgi:hypothetical protein
MPSLPTRSFDTIVQATVAGIQGRAAALIDFGKGSPLLAITQGFASAFLWFQSLALVILSAARLSTSNNIDVDTFTADFMPVLPGTASPRLGAQAASGLLLFSRFTASPQALFIPVGAVVQTTDGTQNFQITADPTFATYSAVANGYTMPANAPTLTIPASAVIAGSGGNVAAGSISTITTPLQGIDSVTNLAAFVNGEDQESDSELKSRFAAYILGLSRGDIYGTIAALDGAEVGAQFKITEDYTLNGVFTPGYYFIVVDDGSGAPPPSFVSAMTSAAWSVRPLGIRLGVFTPNVIFVTVQMQINTAKGYDHNTVCGLVANAIADGINTLGLGVSLNFNQLSAWAYSVSGVTGITGMLLNGLSGDAAFVSATVTTQDGYLKMPVNTIKTNSVIVS